MKKLIFLVLFVAIAGCTQQQRAKQFGGTATVDLPVDARVVTATWKEDDLWVLTKQAGEVPPQQYELTESSSFGVIEGRVVLVEH